jgi:hypothetical protein
MMRALTGNWVGALVREQRKGGDMPLSTVLEVESPEHEFEDDDWEEDEEFGTDEEELELDEYDEGLEEDDDI